MVSWLASPLLTIPIVASGTWTPASVTTAFWYDASNISSPPSSGSALASWNDLSGNGRTLTGTGAHQPIYNTGILNGLPAVHFINNNDTSTQSFMTTASFVLSQPMTFVIAFKSTGASPGSLGSNGTFGILLDDNSMAGNRPILFTVRNDLTNDVAYFAANLIDAGAALAATTGYHLSVILGNGAGTGASNLNGITTSGTSPGTSGFTTGITVGPNNGVTTNAIDLHLCEMFCMPDNGINLANALAYILAKWGV